MQNAAARKNGDGFEAGCDRLRLLRMQHRRLIRDGQIDRTGPTIAEMYGLIADLVNRFPDQTSDLRRLIRKLAIPGGFRVLRTAGRSSRD